MNLAFHIESKGCDASYVPMAPKYVLVQLEKCGKTGLDHMTRLPFTTKCFFSPTAAQQKPVVYVVSLFLIPYCTLHALREGRVAMVIPGTTFNSFATSNYQLVHHELELYIHLT